MNLKAITLSVVGAVTMGMAMAPAANATVAYVGQNTFLNNYVNPPGTPNSDSFARDQKDGFPIGAFDDYWIFTYVGGAGEVSANFVPGSGITGWIGGFYNASGWDCSGGVGTACTGGAIGSLIVESGLPNIATPGVKAFLNAGQYAVRVRGTNTSDQTSYTGQLAFNIPEPGTLALLGLGLIGVGAARRRRV
jgi:hypothetical protein